MTGRGSGTAADSVCLTGTRSITGTSSAWATVAIPITISALSAINLVLVMLTSQILMYPFLDVIFLIQHLQCFVKRIEFLTSLPESGVKYYIEVANMPTTNDALMFLKEQKHMVVAPSKAVNACGVSVSELEMAQNAERLYWSAEEVDAQMHKIMTNIYTASVKAAEKYGLGYDLIAGANIAGFEKVADAMLCQGIF